MNTEPGESQVFEVFSHVDTHRRIAGLIKRHSTNHEDIRGIALNQVDLRTAKDVLELGCGFGSFLEALKGRLPSDAALTGIDIIPEYEPLFLSACLDAEIKGTFFHTSVSQCEKFADNSFDLVLCSFALYFFPHMIPQIARILRPKGSFIAITHDRKNMGKLIQITKDILRINGMLEEEQLPIEAIVGKFCAENGKLLLHPWFGQIQMTDYRNSLIFKPEDIRHIVEYFHFKSPFYLTGTGYDTEDVALRIAAELERSSLSRQGLTISKDDRIFVCSEPVKGGGRES